jgi:hypothetical protein
MLLKPKELQKFRTIWKREFHEEISDEDAKYYISRLLNLYVILFRKGQESKPEAKRDTKR